MRCPVCDAPSTGGQFCVSCGAAMTAAVPSTSAALGTRHRTRPAPGAWLALQEIRLLACPRCGAPNSAARWRCARCGTHFDDDAADGAPAELPAERWGTITPAEQPTAATSQPESARWLALITVVAGVAVVSVAVIMLAARGVGPFGEPDEPPVLTHATSAPVQRVEASAAAGAEGDAANAIDGDPSTAWLVDEPPGSLPWIELRLDQPVQIDHLLVWNGHQGSDDAFRSHNRVREVLIQFPDQKDYTVELPDRDANVRIDMPRPPVAGTIRLTVQSVHGPSDRQTALSEVEALVATPSAP